MRPSSRALSSVALFAALLLYFTCHLPPALPTYLLAFYTYTTWRLRLPTYLPPAPLPRSSSDARALLPAAACRLLLPAAPRRYPATKKKENFAGFLPPPRSTPRALRRP